MNHLDAQIWFGENPTSGSYVISDERRLACGLPIRTTSPKVGGRPSSGAAAQSSCNTEEPHQRIQQ